MCVKVERCIHVHVLMRDERKKQARSNKQARQSNTAHHVHECKSYDIPYSGYFSRGNIFVVFVVERRTTKYLHAKKNASHVVLMQTARATAKFFPRNSQNYDFHENITPRKIPAIR